MGYKTKVDWCDSSWNPVTGCLHGCDYCYARRIAKRFGGHLRGEVKDIVTPDGSVARVELVCAELREPYRAISYPEIFEPNPKGKVIPYPYDFKPTFHRYRLDEPQTWKKPRNIFVCSMADLFGKWVPDGWIREVLDACRKAPQHRYLFLTKNPGRYDDLEDKGIITEKDQNFWLGSTTTDITKDLLHWSYIMNTFQSCEPMLAPWLPAREPNRKFEGGWPKWVIFGAETGNRKGKVIPEKAWVDNAVKQCRNIGAKVFMKESLREIMGGDFVQEFPWEVGEVGKNLSITCQNLIGGDV